MTIYFKNLENVTILGKEGDLIKQKIASAFEHNQRGWLTIYNTDGEKAGDGVPTLIIDLAEVIAVR